MQILDETGRGLTSNSFDTTDGPGQLLLNVIEIRPLIGVDQILLHKIPLPLSQCLHDLLNRWLGHSQRRSQFLYTAWQLHMLSIASTEACIHTPDQQHPHFEQTVTHSN